MSTTISTKQMTSLHIPHFFTTLWASLSQSDNLPFPSISSSFSDIFTICVIIALPARYCFHDWSVSRHSHEGHLIFSVFNQSSTDLPFFIPITLTASQFIQPTLAS